jgi:uncharacterized membrane protein YgaE (UPF0421/DUF939 family)
VAARSARARLSAWVRDGIERVRPLLWPTLQTAVAAGVAWEICVRVLDHPRPIFAPIVAIVAMGFTAGRRGRAAVLLVLGVAIGIGIGDALVRVLDRGAIQVAVVVFVAMTLTLFLTRESLVVVQAGISAALLVGVDRQSAGLAPDRLEDALVGAGVAILISVILFPIDPIRSIRDRLAPIFTTLDRSLTEAATALREDRMEAADQARARRADERALVDAVETARSAVRIAPRRRRAREQVDELATAVWHLEPIVRGVRTIAGASHRVVREGGAPRPDLAEAIDALVGALGSLRRWLESGDDHVRTVARREATASATAGAALAAEGIGPATIAHLVQALSTEILRATGLDAAGAQARLSGTST